MFCCCCCCCCCCFTTVSIQLPINLPIYLSVLWGAGAQQAAFTWSAKGRWDASGARSSYGHGMLWVHISDMEYRLIMTHIKGGGLSHFRRLSWSCIHVLICSAQNWGENPEGVNFYSQEFSSDTGLPQLTVNQQSFVSYSCFRLTSSLLKPAILEVYSPSSHHHRSQLGIVSVLPSCNSSLRAIAGWTTSTEIQAKADRNYLGGCFFPLGHEWKWMSIGPFLRFKSLWRYTTCTIECHGTVDIQARAHPTARGTTHLHSSGAFRAALPA